MSSRVVDTAPEFEKEVRQLQRKYPRVAAQVRRLVLQLIDGEFPGVKVPDSFVQTYKVRLPNPSARRGKSGGFRVYYAVYRTDLAFLITIYFKTEKNDVSIYKVQQRIKQIERKVSGENPGKE